MKVIKYFVFITFFILIKFNAFAQVWKPVEGEITPGWVGVYSMVIDSSDNTLIIGGDFDTINNVVAHYIARWNGYNWTPIGINLPIKPNSLAFFNNELYASSYSSSNHKIYKWNGTTWTVFANSNNYIYTLQTHNGKLYAGGYFSHIGSIAANGIAAWDGTSWSEIGGGFQNLGTEFIQSIEFQDTILYVSGHFDNMNGGVAARNIAGWNGTNWFPLGSGLIDYNGFSPGYANDMEIFNNNLYVGGHFDTAGNIPITGTAVWNGSNWDSVGNGLVYLSNARSLAVFHNELYTGTDGPFQGFNAVIGRFDCPKCYQKYY